MMIDCDACAVRGPACGDCVVTVLLGAPPARRPGDGETGIDLDGREQAAIAVLAGSGLVPPLRLVAASAGDQVHTHNQVHIHDQVHQDHGHDDRAYGGRAPDDQEGDEQRTAV